MSYAPAHPFKAVRAPSFGARPAKADLAGLRRRFAAGGGAAPHRWPSVSLGEAAIDEALPGGGLATGALHELAPFSQGDLAALAGFSLGVLEKILRIHTGFVLLAAPDYHLAREGMFYPPGLVAFGCDPDRLIAVRAPNSKNVLWALEEGLENNALAAVVGILPENDRLYDFTASRRLVMRAVESGVTALLLRSSRDNAVTTAAQTRWSIAAAPSAAQHRRGAHLPGLGAPQWQVRLTKIKGSAPKTGALGGWRVRWDDETFYFRLAAAMADRAPAILPAFTPANAGPEWAAAS